MKTTCLVPYVLDTTHKPPVWRLPPETLQAIDLRVNVNAVGHAVAILSGPVPENAVSLEMGSDTRKRQAWESVTGFYPSGDNVNDWAMDQLSRGADDNHEAGPRPIRTGNGTLVLNFDGRTRRKLNNTDRRQQTVLAQKDLRRVLKMVEDRELPEGIERKLLKAMADHLRIKPKDLKGNDAKLKAIQEVEPTTILTDSFDSGSGQLNGYSNWSAPLDRFTYGSGFMYINGPGDDENLYAIKGVALSSSNNKSILSNLTGGSYHPSWVMCRSNISGSSWYGVDHWATEHRMYRFVSGTGTVLYSLVATAGSSRTLTVIASDSSISGSDTTGIRQVVTDTVHSIGIYGAVGGYIQQTSSGQRSATDFLTQDLLTASGSKPHSSFRPGPRLGASL